MINIITSCGGDNFPTYYMNENFKSYAFFQKGSYWVYQKVSSGDSDKVIQISIITEMTKSRTLGYNYERFYSKLSSTYYKDTTNCFGDPSNNLENKNYEVSEYGVRNSFSLVPNYIDTSIVNFEYNYASNFILKFESMLDSLQVNGVWYKNVKIFNHSPQFNPLQTKRVYYAKM